MSDKPIACSLNAVDLAARAVEWQRALGRSVIAAEETADGFRLSITRDAAATANLRRLAALESGCCAWMNISIEEGERASMTISSASAGGKDVIRMLVPPALLAGAILRPKSVNRATTF